MANHPLHLLPHPPHILTTFKQYKTIACPWKPVFRNFHPNCITFIYYSRRPFYPIARIQKVKHSFSALKFSQSESIFRHFLSRNLKPLPIHHPQSTLFQKHSCQTPRKSLKYLYLTEFKLYLTLLGAQHLTIALFYC